MKGFRNILVGVDLTQGAVSGAPALGLGNREAVERAIWLAHQNVAKLHFISVLHMSERALKMLADNDREHLSRTVADAIQLALANLVREAMAAGVEASGSFVLGRSWVEIIRQVLRHKHDLVIVGARHVHGLRRVLFGSTAMKLLRKCPCPVWVTKPGLESDAMNVLVASDLTPIGVEALSLGLSLRELAGARVHVFHAVQYPLELHWSTGIPDDATNAYHQKARAEALYDLQRQLDLASEGDSTDGVSLHVADVVGVPDINILHFIQDHKIDLLVIGTMARSGIAGMLTGNTAESLLPELSCSVLAIKPTDFVCPVQVE